MKNYLLISFSDAENCFVSDRGKENEVVLEPSKDFSYYLSLNDNTVLKLKEGWIENGESIGSVLDFTGTLISDISHPGSIHGKFAINGLVSSDECSFKFVVEPYGNNDSYFLRYNTIDNKFESAGNNSVR